MGLVRKISVLLFVFIALQGVCAWPLFNIFRWKNLGYEINKAADDAEKDIRKDLLSIKNNIWKETSKALKKIKDNQEIVECIVEKQQEYLMVTDETSLKAIECVNEIRAEVNGIDVEEYGPRELANMKNTYKAKVKGCRNEVKNEFKTIQKAFSRDAAACKVNGSRNPVQDSFYQ